MRHIPACSMNCNYRSHGRKTARQRLVDNAIEQCVLGDKLGIDYAW